MVAVSVARLLLAAAAVAFATAAAVVVAAIGLLRGEWSR